MKYIEIVADAGSADTVEAIAEQSEVCDFRAGTWLGEDGMQVMRILIADDKLQPVLDQLQKLLGKSPAIRIVVMPVEIALPPSSADQRKAEDRATASRESLYAGVERNAQLDLNFLVLTALSTVVAAIGLIEDNVAVVIGAMVIAPLLAPMLAFGLGTALGDLSLMKKALLTAAAGTGLALLMALLIGLFWPLEALSPELLSRTRVGMDAVVLALASGAAAVLSLTTGLSSVLVGVMVAVALLPPVVTFGLLVGHGDVRLALGAGLLLAVNVACVNLAANIVFFAKGVQPRTQREAKPARWAMIAFTTLWSSCLFALVMLGRWLESSG